MGVGRAGKGGNGRERKKKEGHGRKQGTEGKEKARKRWKEGKEGERGDGSERKGKKGREGKGRKGKYILRASDSAHSMLTQCSLSAHYSAHTVLTGENHAFRTFRIRASSVSELPKLRFTKVPCFYSEHCVSTVVSTE